MVLKGILETIKRAFEDPPSPFGEHTKLGRPTKLGEGITLTQLSKPTEVGETVAGIKMALDQVDDKNVH